MFSFIFNHSKPGSGGLSLNLNAKTITNAASEKFMFESEKK